MTYRSLEEWLNRHHVRSTFVLMIALAMLVWVTHWSMDFANIKALSGSEGVGVAAVIAAVQVPASFFAKWAFEVFERIVK